MVPSCSCGRRRSPYCAHSWGLLAGCHIRRAGGSCHEAAGTGTDGTAATALSPAAGDTPVYPHPMTPSAAGGEREKESGSQHFIMKKSRLRKQKHLVLFSPVFFDFVKQKINK